ncbi:MAG: APC family permease [Terriglobia bacterium]|nr:APC family permease [Terriglobia bacterium]
MSAGTTTSPARLRRTLKLWNLIIIGIIIIQPTAPMGIYGVVSNKGHGHVVSAILIAMVAMLFTAISYGRMARIYPSAGSAYTYVGQEVSPAMGYLTGWSMVMDYVLNPLICVAFCAKAAMNIVPGISFYLWAIFFAILFSAFNLFGIKTSARLNEWLCAVMVAVVVVFIGAVVKYVIAMPGRAPGFFTHPFYNPETFNQGGLFRATSVAVLTYIGFDGISTLSEEAENPERNILYATVLVCLITGILSGIEVYGAQLVWGSKLFPSDTVESAFATISGVAGGRWLFQTINFILLIANIGSGMGSQLAAARLLYGMGRGDALPKKFFGVIEPKRRIPRNNVLAVGAFALLGAIALEALSTRLGGGAYEIGAQLLNFGAFIAFMGVNLSSFVHYCMRGRQWTMSQVAPPVLGFVICFFIWLNLSNAAKIVGASWVVVGMLYGAYRTRGFKKDLVNFDIPAEE